MEKDLSIRLQAGMLGGRLMHKPGKKVMVAVGTDKNSVGTLKQLNP